MDSRPRWLQCLVSDNDPFCAASKADDPPCWPLSPQPETARFVSNLEPQDSMSHDVKIPATKSSVVHRGAEKQPLAKVLLSRRPPCFQSFSEIIRRYLLVLVCVVESLQSHTSWSQSKSDAMPCLGIYCSLILVNNVQGILAAG